MKLVHLSDIHLSKPGELVEGLDPHGRLDLALAHIRLHHSDADRVIITGDLTHWGEAEAYEALRQALSSLSVPVRLMIGNHDARDGFLAAFPDHPRDAQGFIQYAEDTEAGRLIYCDSIQSEAHEGHLDQGRMEWLSDQLAGCDTAWIFLHHNPLDLGDPATDELSLVPSDQEALRSLLKAHPGKVRHIFFGHVHEALCGTMSGVPFSGVASLLHQTVPNLSPSPTSTMGPLEPSYRVILIREDDVVIHQIPFAWSGPVVRHGNAWEDWARDDAAPGGTG